MLRLNLQYFAEVEPPAEETPVIETPIEEPPAKTFTQEELDNIVKDRLQRDRKKYADYDDLKAAKEAYEAAEKERKEGEMTELDKLKAQLDEKLTKETELSTKLTQLQDSIRKEKIRNAFDKVASSNNIAYLDDAYTMADLSAVEFGEDGSVSGVDKAVEELVKNKPYLVGTKQQKAIGEPTNDPKPKADKTSEQLLKEAAEKARRSGKTEDRAAYATLKRELGK